MKLRFLTSVASDRYRFIRGQVIEPTQMDDHLIRLLNEGACEVVPDDPDAAVVRPRERAVTRRPRQGRTSATVPRIVAGGLAICLGGGPSLTAEDVSACQGHGVVIAINDAYKLAPWADVLYAADATWWGWHRGVPDFVGLKYSLQAAAAKWPGVEILKNTGQTGIDFAPTGLRTGRNSGYQAINLAIHLGATTIALLGYDMQATGGRQHWFGDHPNRSQSPYGTFREMFASMMDPLAGAGVHVINCSRETALTCFPREPLEALLARLRAA
jgi:hypothetical protein